jgi:hypothetical protein
MYYLSLTSQQQIQLICISTNDWYFIRKDEIILEIMFGQCHSGIQHTSEKYEPIGYRKFSIAYG